MYTQRGAAFSRGPRPCRHPHRTAFKFKAQPGTPSAHPGQGRAGARGTGYTRRSQSKHHFRTRQTLGLVASEPQKWLEAGRGYRSGSGRGAGGGERTQHRCAAEEAGVPRETRAFVSLPSCEAPSWPPGRGLRVPVSSPVAPPLVPSRNDPPQTRRGARSYLVQGLGGQLRRPKQVGHGPRGCGGGAGGGPGGLRGPGPGAPTRGAGAAREQLGVALLLALAQQQRRPGAAARARCRLHRACKRARRSPVRGRSGRRRLPRCLRRRRSLGLGRRRRPHAPPPPRPLPPAAAAPPPGLNVVPPRRGTWRQARRRPIGGGGLALAPPPAPPPPHLEENSARRPPCGGSQAPPRCRRGGPGRAPGARRAREEGPRSAPPGGARGPTWRTAVSQGRGALGRFLPRRLRPVPGPAPKGDHRAGERGLPWARRATGERLKGCRREIFIRPGLPVAFRVATGLGHLRREGSELEPSLRKE